MTKFNFLSIIFLFSYLSTRAQVGKIDTDRPDQTESAHTVPRNYFQAEFGFNKENTSYRNYDLVHPTALLKYGFKKWELRIETTSRSSYEQLIPNPRWTTGFEPVEVGFKAALCEEQKWRPRTSLIVHMGLPFLASKAFKPQHLAPSFRFAMQNTITKTVALGYNLGAMWDGFSSTPVWLYTFAPGFELGEKWYAYVEAFGFIQSGQHGQHSLDGGIACYISPDFKLDLSGGFGISPAAPKNYIAFGFSFRVNTRRHKTG